MVILGIVQRGHFPIIWGSLDFQYLELPRKFYTTDPNSKTCIKAVYNVRVNPEVTPWGQWIKLMTDKGLVFSNVNNFFS